MPLDVGDAVHEIITLSDPARDAVQIFVTSQLRWNLLRIAARCFD
jgi:hypothetical protein